MTGEKRRDLDLSLPEGPPTGLPEVEGADRRSTAPKPPSSSAADKVEMPPASQPVGPVGAAQARQEPTPVVAPPIEPGKADGPAPGVDEQITAAIDVLRGHPQEPIPLPEPPRQPAGSDALPSSGSRGPSLLSRLAAANTDDQLERDELARAREESLQRGPTVAEPVESEAGGRTGWFERRVSGYGGDWPLAEQGTIPSAAVQQEAGNRRVAPPMLSPPAYGEENLSAPATARDDDEDWLRSGPSAEPASASQHALPPDSGTPEPVGRSGQAPSTQARSGPLAPPVRQETSPAASISLIHQIAAELREEGTFSRDLNGPEVAGIMSGVIESLVSVPEEKQGEVTIGGVDNLVVSIKRRQGTVTAGVKVTKPNIPVKIPVKCVLGNSGRVGELRLISLSIGLGLTKIALAALGKALGVDVEDEARKQLSHPNQALTQVLNVQLKPMGVRITKAEMSFGDEALTISLKGGPI